MIVRALKTFRDLKEGTVREAGDTFEVSVDRFAQINGTKYGKLVEAKPEEVAEQPKRQRRSRKQG